MRIHKLNGIVIIAIIAIILMNEVSDVHLDFSGFLDVSSSHNILYFHAVTGHGLVMKFEEIHVTVSDVDTFD